MNMKVLEADGLFKCFPENIVLGLSFSETSNYIGDTSRILAFLAAPELITLLIIYLFYKSN